MNRNIDNRNNIVTQTNEAAGEGLSEVQAQHVPHSTTHSGNQGASPSNTAPPNYINNLNQSQDGTFLVLHQGIDSLYFSAKGTLNTGVEEKLEALKIAAKSTNEWESASAQYEIGDHIFEVKPKGRGRHAYQLVDNHFEISLASRTASNIPLAYIKVRSELLLSHYFDDILSDLTFILNSLGVVTSELSVSRVDLCVDFVSTVEDYNFPRKEWVTRTRDYSHYFQGDLFTGHSFGKDGMVARLYHKQHQAEQKGLSCFFEVWKANGWDGQTSVWRMEYQFRKSFLKELLIITPADLFANLNPLWQYATGKWLRLSIPSKDSNQSRWPNHPLWDSLSSVQWSGEFSPTLPTRVRTQRLPSEYYLYVNGIAFITSFMAIHQITDFIEGFERFVYECKKWHDDYSTKGNFVQYLGIKLREKNKRFNLIRNSNLDISRIEEDDAYAYQRERDGE